MNESTENAKTKALQFKALIILAMVVMGVLALFVWMLSNSQEEKKKIEKLNFSDPLKHADPESVVLEKVQKGIEDTKKQNDDLKKQFDDEFNKKNSQNTREKELEERLALLEKKLSQQPEVNQSNAMSGGEGYQGQVIPRSPGYQNSNINVSIDDSMREDKLILTPTDSNKRLPIKNPDSYVPAGTYAQAVMLSGADASTAVTSPHNPNPMLFRIISDGTLPNHKKSHLKDCLVTGYVAGDISSERGEIMIYKISCTLPNNEIIDPKVEGWIFGRDGKFGVRGRPVWREGKLLQRAFAAGALSGISEGISQTYSSNSISPLGNTLTTNSGKIFQVGAAKGTSKAMDKLADYNIQRAEQYHPVIQISPGDTVDVVFRDGFFIDGKKHDHDEENKANQNIFYQTNSTETPQPTFLSQEEKTLPLSAEQVRKIQENNKQLGFRINE